METRPYVPFDFNHCANIDRIGLIKINSKNYELLKDSTHPQVYYNAAIGVLMVDTNLVRIDDELADDVAMHLPAFLPKPSEETTLFIPEQPLARPAIRPAEFMRLFSLV